MRSERRVKGKGQKAEAGASRRLAPASKRVLMLSWEYPPKIVGGIARHVQELSEALVQQGVEVHVITADHPQAPAESCEQGVYLHRVAPRGYANDFVHWVHLLNFAMEARAESLLEEWLAYQPPKGGRLPILLHAHDWLAYFSAVSLKHRYQLPLIATFHATEHGRHGGLPSDTSRYIHQTEWQLSYEAWRVIVCSEFMKGEVQAVLGVPPDKIDVIPNGIRAEKFDFPLGREEREAVRARFAAPDEKLIFSVGRMVREKGMHRLIEALPKVKALYPKVKLVLAGGGYRDHLVQFARFLRLEPSLFFTDFIPDEELLKLYKVADVAVYPSLYEPFGIVALEAMAARVPVVVSDIGGFREIVQHEVTGITTWANNSDSLAWGILRVLTDPEATRERVKRAYRYVREIFNWDQIARQTLQVYQRVWQEYKKSDWECRRGSKQEAQAIPQNRNFSSASSERAR